MKLKYLGAIVLCAATATSCGSTEPGADSPSAITHGILFVGGKSVTTNDIFLINLDGSGKRNLTNRPANYGRPTVSPDGTQIAFVRATSPIDPPGLYVAAPWDGAPQLLSDRTGIGWTPSWSPDGTQLAIAIAGDLFTINPKSAAVTRLTFDSAIGVADPTWSPDGTQLVYSKWDTAGHRYVLHRIQADGSNDTLLLDPGEYNAMSPAWTADGSGITYEHQAIDHYLYRLDVGTGIVTAVTGDGNYDRWPTSSPAGDTVAFTRLALDTLLGAYTQELYFVVGGSGQPVRVTQFGTSMSAFLPTWAGER